MSDEKTQETKVDWRPVKVLSQDVIALIERLKKLEYGQTVPYLDLNAIVRGNVQHEQRYKLHTAINKCLDMGIVLHCVNNIGVKRLTDQEAVETLPAFLKKVRRAARKQHKRMTSVQYEKLSKEAQVQHNAGLAMLGTITLFTEKKRLEAVTQKVISTNGTLSIGQTLDLFVDKKK